jgi:hypothetical protein
MIALIASHCSKGVKNIDTSSKRFTWFKTNFNMPVVDYSGGTYVRYQGDFTYEPADVTSFNLSGFLAGFEICVAHAVFDFDNNSGSTFSINTTISCRWVYKDDATTIGATVSDHVTFSLPAGNWIEWWQGVNIGTAPWEIDSSGTYHFKAKAVGTPNISEINLPIVMSNAPSVTQLSSDKVGHIWVEGELLTFVNANRWKHSLAGSLVASGLGSDKGGYIWIDTSNNLHWVSDNGNHYTTTWKVKQFASFYSNGATGAVNAGTDKKGYMWVDSQFGDTHLAYIGNDGFKYLVGAGDDPYA